MGLQPKDFAKMGTTQTILRKGINRGKIGGGKGKI